MPRAALSATKPKKQKHTKSLKIKKVMGELIPAKDADEIEYLTEGVTDRAKQFVFEYLSDLQATKAAVRAGYSEINARNQSAVLLANPAIKQAIKIALDSRLRAVNVTADRIVSEYAKIAFLNPKDLYAEDGGLKEISEIPDDVAACIASIEIEQRRERGGDDGGVDITTKKVKIADKIGALNALAKMAIFSGTFGKQSAEGNGGNTTSVQFNYTVNLRRG